MFSSHRKLLVMALALFGAALLVLFRDMHPASLNQTDIMVLWQLRLPLVITSALVGAALAVSSASLQVLLRNPLADPGIIGITSGASLFASFFLLLGSGLTFTQLQYGLPLFCFLGALTSTLLIYLIARRMPGVSSAVILAGIAISTLSGALVAWLHLFSDAQSMRNLTFWLMGSLHQADWTILRIVTPVLLLLLGYLLLQGRPLNWYYFGAQDAQMAGLDVKRFSRRMLLCCALLVGISVSIAGAIAFVGLLVPHLLRNLFGFDNRFILPASALSGGLLLMLVSLLSEQTVGFSIPVSMLTATLGGPLFLYSVLRLSRQGG